MAVYNGLDGYNNLSPFKHWFTKFYAQGTFQFDTGAIIAGDWTHVQILYTYQAYYSAISGVPDGTVWEWHCMGMAVFW